MKITREADYALRILYLLASEPKRTIGAAEISELTMVTIRFTLKIMRKLTSAGFVQSFKGSYGGYRLSRPANEITVLQAIESIDGPLAFNRCVGSGDCEITANSADCFYHLLFCSVNKQISKALGGITISDAVDSNVEKIKELKF